MNFKKFGGYLNLSVGTAVMAANFVDNDPGAIVGFLVVILGSLMLSHEDKP